MKSLIASIAILGVAGLAVGTGAGADTTAEVSATVTAELITISVADGSVEYGIVPIDTLKTVQTQVVTNNSNVAVDLDVKSSNAIGGTQWTLAATNAALDEFTHESSPDGSTWTAFNVDNTTLTSLATNVAADGGVQDLDLRIKTPLTVTDNIEKTITVTVQASII